MTLSVDILAGDAAWSLIRDASFCLEWDALWAQCPWATVFQSRGFVSTWYDVYQERFTPVVAVGRSAQGALEGLLTLALPSDQTRLVVAGTHHAEYQIWLSVPVSGVTFGCLTFSKLKQHYPGKPLRLRYIPPGAPTAAFTNSKELARRTTVVSHKRPVARINDIRIEDSFRKSGNKSRINRLKRQGELKLDRLRDVSQLDRHLDEIIEQCDFRHGAVHGVLPFASDDLKRKFHRQLMADHPETVHVVTLTCGDRLIAAHYGFATSSQAVHTGILVHSPFHAGQSPGKLLLLFLIRCLQQQGIGALDLTPGGDSWKDRFATEHEIVYETVVYSSVLGKVLARLKTTYTGLARRIAKGVGLSTGVVTSWRDYLRPSIIAEAKDKFLRAFFSERVETKVFSIKISDLDEFPVRNNSSSRADCISDLLKYAPVERWQSKRKFLESALSRLERGEHVFTISDNDRLLHFGWLIERQKYSFVTEAQQGIQFSSSASVLYDFYTFPEARAKGFYQLNLAVMLDCLIGARPSAAVYIMARADNAVSCHVIEKTGFKYQLSLFFARTRGRVSRWVEPCIPEVKSDYLPVKKTLAALPQASKWREVIRWRIRYFLGFIQDILYNVDTTRSVAMADLIVNSTHRVEAVDYEPTPWNLLSHLFERWTLETSNYTFVDFGSGKGRVVLMAAGYPFRTVIGVEFSKELCHIATRNIKRSRAPRRCAKIAVANVDALELSIPEEPSIFFFYNPFAPSLAVRIAEKISRACVESLHPTYLIFFACSDDYIAALQASPILTHCRRHIVPLDIFFSGRIDVFELNPARMREE